MPAPGYRRSKASESARAVRAAVRDPASPVAEVEAGAPADSALIRILLGRASVSCGACGGSGKRTRGNCKACDGSGRVVTDPELASLIDDVRERGAPIRDLMAAALAVYHEVGTQIRGGEIERATTGYRVQTQVLETARKLSELDVDGRLPSQITLSVRPRAGLDSGAVLALLEEADCLDEAIEAVKGLVAEASPPPGGDLLEVG